MNMTTCAVCGTDLPTAKGRGSHERIAHPEWTPPPELRRARTRFKNERWRSRQTRSWRFLQGTNVTAIRYGQPRLGLHTVLPNGPCAYCGGPSTSWDHVVPLGRGGPHTVENLVPSCWPCNNRKSVMSAERYLARVEDEANGLFV